WLTALGLSLLTAATAAAATAGIGTPAVAPGRRCGGFRTCRRLLATGFLGRPRGTHLGGLCRLLVGASPFARFGIGGSLGWLGGFQYLARTVKHGAQCGGFRFGGFARTLAL